MPTTDTVPSDSHNLPYRRGVGICVFNKNGLVLVAERHDTPGAWQMPQGGIQKGEEPRAAVLRELKEEIGTNNVEIVAQVPEWLRYEFPDYMQYNHGIFRGKYRGQEQIWFAARFLGQDSEIDISGLDEPEKPEFVSWKWVKLADLPKLIVPFKRPVYERIVEAFAAVVRAG